MRDITIKTCLIGLVFFLSKATVLAQDQDIRCEVSGLDFNLSRHDPGYLIEFGSFSLFAEGEEVKSANKEKIGAMITRFYKLPRTKLVLSVSVVHYPKDEPKPIEDVLVMSMILGKNRISRFSDFDNEKRVKDTVSLAHAGYPMELFEQRR